MNISVFLHHAKEAARELGIPLSEMLKKAYGFGVSYVDADLDDMEEFLSTGECGGVRVSSIYATYDLAHKDAFLRYHKHINTAKKMGCKSILIVPGLFSSSSSSVKEKELPIMLKRMKKICAYAHKCGIIPTIEDYDNVLSPIATYEGMLTFLNEIPELMVSFDTGNFKYSAEDELVAFEKLKDRIVHVHLKDRGLSDNGTDYTTAVDGAKLYAVPVGYGAIKIPEIIKRLKDMGYNGNYAMEFFGSKDYAKYIEDSASFLKNL